MMPSGTPTPVGSGPPANPSLLPASAGVLSEPGSLPSQPQLSVPVSPRNHFGNANMSLVGNISNGSSLLGPSFGNGGTGAAALPGLHMNPLQRSGMGAMVMAGSAVFDSPTFTSSSGQLQGRENTNPTSNPIGSVDHAHGQQVGSATNYQQQFSVPRSQQQQLGCGLERGSAFRFKRELGTSDQLGLQQQQLPSTCDLGLVKSEPQQLQSIRNLGSGSAKFVPLQHSDLALSTQQQQQQQQQPRLSRQSSQAAAQMNLLQQQRILQLQQQQQLLKSLSSQRPRLQQQEQQQPQSQSFWRAQVKPAAYEPGTCARRLTHYLYQLQHKPSDNNIQFWRKFVKEYFAPRARKRWCVSLYQSGRQTNAVLSQDAWHCELCNCKPGRGFETTVEALPRLFKIKYDSGTLEELLYIDVPQEYLNVSGQVVLDYAKATQESLYEQLRVVHNGKLRIVFNSDLKICSWEFCVRCQEELIPRRLILPQVSQLGAVAKKYQVITQNASSNSGLPFQELQNFCNYFAASVRQLAKVLEMPLVNDLGYTKRYVRGLQISEVVNIMKDLIDHSRETHTGPIQSLIDFPRSSSAPTSNVHGQVTQQSDEQQIRTQNSNHDDQSPHASGMVQQQHASTSNSGAMSMNNMMNPPSSATSVSAIVGLHQSHMNNTRQQNPTITSSNGPYVQISSACSSPALPQQPLLANHRNLSSPFPCTTTTTSAPSNGPQATHNNGYLSTCSSPANVSMIQQPVIQQSNDAQNSMQQLIQDIMMYSQSNAGSLGNNMAGVNGVTPDPSLAGNGIGSSGSGMGDMIRAGNSSGIRVAMGRGGMGQMSREANMNHQQQRYQPLPNANGFNNDPHFDWRKTTS